MSTFAGASTGLVLLASVLALLVLVLYQGLHPILSFKRLYIQIQTPMRNRCIFSRVHIQHDRLQKYPDSKSNPPHIAPLKT